MISRRVIVMGGGALVLTGCATNSVLNVREGLPLPANTPLRELDVVVGEGDFPGKHSGELAISGYFGDEWKAQFSKVIDAVRNTYGLSGSTVFISKGKGLPVKLQSQYVATFVPKTMTWKSNGGWLDIYHDVTVTDRVSRTVHFSGGVEISPYATQRMLYAPEKRREGEVSPIFQALAERGLIKTVGK